MKLRALMVFAVFAGAACGPSGGTSDRAARQQEEIVYDDIQSDLDVLAGSRGYFGHQSVGFNLMDGVADILGEVGETRLQVLELSDPSSASDAGLYHAAVGRNRYPKEKVDDFAAAVRSMSEAPPDYALVKFCYVDFLPGTDVDDVFSYYAETIGRLKQELPGVTFVHVTAPLKTRDMSLGSRLRRLLGREELSDTSNMLRSAYSRRVLEEYGSESVFDLARIESTRPDGTRVSFSRSGWEYYSMDPAYSDDGGHLNELGRKLAAAEMVRVLADAARRGRENSPE